MKQQTLFQYNKRYFNMGLSGLFGLVIVLSAILIIVWLYMNTLTDGKSMKATKSPERLRNIIGAVEPSEPSVDMVDFNHDDPKFSKYSRRFQDAMGMDGSDYYYENDTMFRQGIEDEKFGENLFKSKYGLPGTRGYVAQPYNPEDRWYDVPSGRMDGSVESAELLVGSTDVTNAIMAERQSNALYGDTEHYTSLTDMTQADALFG